MALNLQVSARTPITVPLAADPALVEANPTREDGTMPTLRYAITGDCEGLVIPHGVSTATIRALTKDEFREAQAAAGCMPDRGRRIYLRVIEEIQRRADAKDSKSRTERAEALVAALGWLAAADLPDHLRETLARGLAAEGEALNQAELLAEEPATEAAVLEDLKPAEYTAYLAFCQWQRQRRREVARRGLLAISDVPDVPRPGKDGYPVEALLQDENGEAVIEEVAAHIEHIGTLGKALPRCSGCSSGVSEAASSSGTPVPPETSATDGFEPTQGRPSAAAS